MHGKHLIVLGLGALLTTWSQPTAAQTIEERVRTLESTVETGLAGTLGIEIHALVSSTYTYSINNPDQKEIELRTDTFKDNNIDLNQASLFFSRTKDDEPFGIVVNLDFGTTAEAIAASWGSESEGSNSFEVREAYLTYDTAFTLPSGYPLSLKAGKFVTLLGWEVIKSYDAVNDNISKSTLFGFSIPFTHTGILTSLPINDMFAVDLGVVNGWDNVKDNNDSKTVLGGIAIAPTNSLSIYIAGTYGAELDDNGKSKRGTVTANAAWQAADYLTVVVDGTFATENDALPSRDGGPCLRSADWYGAAGYAVVGITDHLSFTLRGEVFDDPDGNQTATGLAPDGAGTVWGITPTVSYQLTGNVLARFEYRHDEASNRYFGKEDHLHRGSDTFGAELIYAF